MKLLDFLKFNFNRPKKTAAQVAKERLQIIVSHESARQTSPDMMKKLQKELLEVICKYVHIDQDKIKVQLERHGDQSVLELNVTLQEDTLEKSIASGELVFHLLTLTRSFRAPSPKIGRGKNHSLRSFLSRN